MGERNRNIGEVYTPSSVADLMYKVVQERVPGFDKTNLVWDCCWGTGNLTKEKKFDNLFCSTLRAVDIRKNMRNNPGSTKFVYNFLDDDVDCLKSPHAMMTTEKSMPSEIEEALSNNQPIMFYINPPYVTSYNGDGSCPKYNPYGMQKGSDTNSKVKQEMIDRKLGRCADQMYIQFLYKMLMIKRAYKHSHMSIALISPLMFLTGSYANDFRNEFLSEFYFSSGYAFKASEFEGLSGDYALGITLWESGEQENKREFNFKVIKDFNNIEDVADKLVYNLGDDKPLGVYLRETETLDEVAEYTASSGVRIEKNNPKGVKMNRNAFGYLFYKANNIYHYKDNGIITVPFKSWSSIPITKRNADICFASMTARLCNGRYKRNDYGWVDDKDEFCIPDMKNEEWGRLVLNSYMYLMFTGQTHLSSVVADDGTEFPNYLFHLSYEYMEKLFAKYGREIKAPEKRPDGIVVEKIAELFKYPEMIYPYGKDLWQAGMKMWDDTMEKRFSGYVDPMYQVERWDAGFYQIKQLTKEDTKMVYLKEFNKILKEFEVHIREAVYKVGFIKG